MSETARQEVEALSRRMHPALIAFFTRRVRNRAEAEDLTQEVFVRLVRTQTQLQSADAYVFQIAANLLRDKARADRVRHDYAEAKSLEDYLGIDTLDPYIIAADRQELAKLSDLMTKLPEKTRRIFMLYRVEHIDKHSIAESFGVSIRMVEIHVKRALTLLAEGMGKS